MRKVFLDDLPHFKYGDSERVDWEKSIGKVNFIFDDTQDSFEIIEYNSKIKELLIIYDTKQYKFKPSQILNCRLSRMLNVLLFEHKYKVGDIVGKNNSFKITKLIKKKINNNSTNQRAYECICLDCLGKIVKSEYSIDDSGCPICSNRPLLIVKGINDIHTTNPELAKLLANPEDGYKYSQGSRKVVNWKCPNCETIISKPIKEVKKSGLACKCCGDGFSIPEKYFYSLCVQLKKLGVIDNFITQYRPEWAIKTKNEIEGSKFYDFLLNENLGNRCLCEIHGIQHYKETHRKGAKSLKAEQENDRIKEQLAKQNTNYPYIILDVRESTIEWFKNSVMTSILPKYYGFTEGMINWDEIFINSSSSLKKICWELYNSGIHEISQIQTICHLSYSCVLSYLKDGVKFNKCCYSAKTSRNISASRNKIKKQIKVICLQTKQVYDSIVIASEETGIGKSNIGNCCRGFTKLTRTKDGKRYQWMYYSDYLSYNEDDIKAIIDKVDTYVDKSPYRVICINNLQVYKSAFDASKQTNVGESLIINCCNGESNCGGSFPDGTKLQWMYHDEYLQIKDKNSIDAYCHKGSKKVICITNKNTYKSIKEAALITGICAGNISSCCIGKTSHAGKSIDGIRLVWMYYNDYLNSSIEDIMIKINNAETLNTIINPKKVICLNNNQVYSTIMEASKIYKINRDSISLCCKGKKNNAGKDPITQEPLCWQYYSDWINEHPEENLEKIS